MEDFVLELLINWVNYNNTERSLAMPHHPFPKSILRPRLSALLSATLRQLCLCTILGPPWFTFFLKKSRKPKKNKNLRTLF